MNKTINLLEKDGRWVLYGLLSGAKTELNLGALLMKRIQLITTTLKTRSKEYKNNLIENFSKTILPEFETGKCKPVISESIECDWNSVNAFIEGHQKMESNVNAGKIIIKYK